MLRARASPELPEPDNFAHFRVVTPISVNKPLQLLAMFGFVALVAAAACYVSARVFGPLRPQPGVSGHEWIHQQLGLSPDEQKALESIETKFAQRKRNLMGEIHSANRELAEAIGPQPSWLRKHTVAYSTTS
jgi:hypothetical protein